MAKGGRRPGAGRPKGSVTRPQIRSFFSDKEIKDLVADVKKRAKEDPVLMRWLMDQLFGKATQPLSGDDENPLTLQITGMKVEKDK